VLFEEYADRIVGRLTLSTCPRTILLHGHCHQRSMGLVPPAQRLLSKVPGASVVALDAGCCGMAGSWGYARDHFDLSRAIGERKLFPAVRSRTAGTIVAAAGTSCRHQLLDFTGVQAVHPAVLLQSLLTKADSA
jgi:Fe-S oxidoreductase